ncbi:MAG: DUF2721 domain-containing protein [Arhodomonas sp.]|nr:DUF2721 domain-containing protein [Arhodomonas sp.]
MVLIRNMQVLGVSSLFVCVLCMLVLMLGWMVMGQWLFAASLVLMMLSLGVSVREIQISVDALNIQLADVADGQSGAPARRRREREETPPAP